ncbi:MAG: aminotransferase class V-fold PLP-dependent enzyme [bacterium]|nr:aminotransferase class V-fold PLP-dependent enzyme [bacterium]
MHRREAIQKLSVAAALFQIPAEAAESKAPPLPGEKLLAKDAEKYWARVRREQFLLPKWRSFLNNGSLGVAPRAVVHAVADYLERSAALAMDEYPRWGYETLDEFRTELAAFAGCKMEELALTHNATEAMCIIAGGMDLKPGDEVLITDQEHPSGRCCWYQKQARSGIKVREVKIPLPPESPEQLTDVMVSAMSAKTRVISFSGITTKTGLIMPIRQICDAARSKGVLTVVDGAHMNGQVDFRISDLGCDYFAGSPHKWLFAPAGCGLLYIRDDRLDQHWPLVITQEWDKKELKAARFMRMGTNNRAIFEGMMAGLRFAKALGPGRIYRRIHHLARGAYEKARQLPYVEMLSATDHQMYGALVTFRLPEDKVGRLFEECDRQRIWTTRANPLRLATHIHTRPQDLDQFFETVREIFG